jgi:uncharacterized protein (TIGR02145 family)
MKKVNFKRNSLMAGFGLALSLTFSCSSESGGDVEYGLLIDERDNAQYKTVVIGNKEWMAENLKYDSAGYGRSYCDTLSKNCNKYGVLYDWAAAMNIGSTFNANRFYFPGDYDESQPHKGVCPRGWHIPSDAEWNALITAVGGLSKSAAKLKSASGWKSNGNGTDDYGFKALPGGYADYSSSSSSGSPYKQKLAEETGIWWSLEENAPDSAYGRRMEHKSEFVGRVPESKAKLFSIRCAREYQGSNSNMSSSGGGSSSGGSKFIDGRDSKAYKAVDIGAQTWMAENLDYRGAKNDIGVCYGKKTENCDKYGRLYDWADAMTVCPMGWHLPSEAEWLALLNKVGIPNGKQLKSASGWENNGNGTDSYGFKALPGGGGLADKFNSAGHSGIWWSETEIAGTANAVNLYINNNSNDVGWDVPGKQYLFSVRCVMD